MIIKEMVMKLFYISCLAFILTVLLSAASYASNDFFSEDGGGKKDTTTKDFFADQPTKSDNSGKDLFKDDGGSYTSGGYLDDIEAARVAKQKEELKKKQARETKQRKERRANALGRYEKLRNEILYGSDSKCRCIWELCLTASSFSDKLLTDPSFKRNYERNESRRKDLCVQQLRDIERQYENVLNNESARVEDMEINESYDRKFEALNTEYVEEQEYVRQQREKRKQQQQNNQANASANKITERERLQREVDAKKVAKRKKKDEKWLQDCLEAWRRGSNQCTCAKFVDEHGPQWARNAEHCAL